MFAISQQHPYNYLTKQFVNSRGFLRLMETAFAFKKPLSRVTGGATTRASQTIHHAELSSFDCKLDGTGSIVECANKCEKAEAAGHFA